MPLFQITPSPMPPQLVTQQSSVVAATAHHSPSPVAAAQSAYPNSVDHQPLGNNYMSNHSSERDERKSTTNHVSSIHIGHSNNSKQAQQFDQQQQHLRLQAEQQQQQHMFMKSMTMDLKHELTPDEARKPLNRGGPAKEPIQQYAKPMQSIGTVAPPKNQPTPRRDHRYRGPPNVINERDMILVRQQQEYLARSQPHPDVVLEQQQQQQMQMHQRRINDIPVEMQASTVGVIVKRDMHPQHLQPQQMAQPSLSAASYSNKRNSYAPPGSIMKTGQQSHSPSPLEKQPNSWPGGRVMYEYRQIPIQSIQGDGKSNAHLLYQTVVPPPPQQQQQQQPHPTSKLMPISMPPMVTTGRHHNIASPPINNKSKVSAPAPSHIYGKPIELNPNPGICSGIPVCQSRRESPSKVTYTPSPIGSNSASSTGPPPAHLSRPMNDMRHFQSRHPMHASSPPPAGPQSPSPSLIVQNPTTVSPMASPMLHTGLPPGHAVHTTPSSPSSFQTQPLDLGVSSRTDHQFNSKRKAPNVLSISSEALDVRKKRMEPIVNHLSLTESPAMFSGVGGQQQQMPSLNYRSSEPRTRPFTGQQPPLGQYEPIAAGSAQSIYVPLTVSSEPITSSRNNNNHHNSQHHYIKPSDANNSASKATFAVAVSPEEPTNLPPARQNNNNNSVKEAVIPAVTAVGQSANVTPSSPTPFTTISKVERIAETVPPPLTKPPQVTEPEKPSKSFFVCFMSISRRPGLFTSKKYILY